MSTAAERYTDIRAELIETQRARRHALIGLATDPSGAAYWTESVARWNAQEARLTKQLIAVAMELAEEGEAL